MKQADLNLLLEDTKTLGRSTTLIQETGVRALLLHLRAGEHMPEHQTRAAITIQCLNGEVRFTAGEETVVLRPGLLISLPPGAPHSLLSQQDASLLLTLAEHKD